MAGKVKLVTYPLKEKVRLAGALALRELGLVEKLREVLAKQEEDEKEAALQALPSSLEKLAESSDAREDAVLEEIFNTPDVAASSESKEEILFEEFRQSALLLVGLAVMVEKMSSDQKRLKVLEAGQAEPQPLFLVLSFFHQWLSAGGLEDNLEPWLEEGLSAVPQLLNLKVEHPFLEDCRHLCTEFLEDSLPSLLALEEEHLQSALASFLAQLCKSRTIGKHAVSCIVARFSHLADELREAERFCCSPAHLLRQFELLMSFLLQLWPRFLSSVLPSRSQGLRKETGSSLCDLGDMVPKKASKKRSSGGGSFQPLLGLRETSDLQAEVTRWQSELEGCTAHLSILHPEFCDAIWSVVAFCRGLLDNLVC